MSFFLSPAPAAVDVRFETPRTNHVSASGISINSYRAVGFWKGTCDFRGERGGSGVHLGLARADLPGSAYFQDIVEGDPIPREAPRWLTAATGSNVNQVALPANHGAKAGDLISVRQSGYPQFVTARRIHAFAPNLGGGQLAFIDVGFPEEFFPIVPDSVLEFCLNRPHVRATFDRPPQRWRKSDPVTMQTSQVSWIEDTSGTLLALRELSGITGTEPDAIITNDGLAIQTEDSIDIDIDQG